MEIDKIRDYVQHLMRRHPSWNLFDIRSQMRHNKIKLVTLPILRKWKRELETEESK